MEAAEHAKRKLKIRGARAKARQIKPKKKTKFEKRNKIDKNQVNKEYKKR